MNTAVMLVLISSVKLSIETKQGFSELRTQCFPSYLDKIVRKQAPFPVEVSLHPAILLDVPHVLDDVTRLQRQLVLMMGVVLVLHDDLFSTKGVGGDGSKERQQG